MAGTGYNAVSVAHLNHHNSECGVVGSKALERKLGSHALCLTKLNKLINICLKLLSCLGVDDLSTRKIETLAKICDVSGITEKNYFSVAFLNSGGSCLENSAVLSLG